jgi:hypothetical protein
VRQEVEQSPLVRVIVRAIQDARIRQVELSFALRSALRDRRAGEHGTNRRDFVGNVRVNVDRDQDFTGRSARGAQRQANAGVGPAIPNLNFEVGREPVAILLANRAP